MEPNKDMILKGLAVVVKAFRAKHPKYVFDKHTSSIYLQLLSDLPGEAVYAACLDHISKSPFFPGVSDIRERATEIMTQGSRRLTPHEAWAEVLRTFGEIGERRHDDPLVEKTVQSLGGWRVLGMSDNQVADRARFIESYNIFVEREKASVITLPIVNQVEAGDQPRQLVEREVRLLVERLAV